MKLNSIRRIVGDYKPPAAQGLHGPEVLAELMVHGRQFGLSTHGGSSFQAPLSDDGVKKLVNLVYYSSLMPEEGRFPRFKVVCRDTPLGFIFLVSRIDPVALDGVDPLRRLVPACTNPDSSHCLSRNGIGSSYATAW